MEEVYSYRLQGRRLVVWSSAVAIAMLCMLALYEKAPWFIWAIWLPCAAMLLFLLIKNPTSGVRLMRDRLILSPWQKPREIMLKDVQRVVFVSWSDSTDMEIHTADGGKIRVFSGDIPPKEPFMSKLEALGVPVFER